MRTLKIPQAILRHVDKLRRIFLWQDWVGRNKIHAIKWDQICKPTWLGGLGIRDLNMAFLAKTAWRIASQPDSVVSSLFRAKYHRNCQFWDAPMPGRASWSWRSIVKGKNLVKE
ncbi:hypothetical protein MKX03_032113, partial [Papaver bracteatum]